MDVTYQFCNNRHLFIVARSHEPCFQVRNRAEEFLINLMLASFPKESDIRRENDGDLHKAYSWVNSSSLTSANSPARKIPFVISAKKLHIICDVRAKCRP